MIRAVLFDRDGTLIVDDPTAGSAVTLMPLAREAIGHLRRRGVRIGVVTNQPHAAARNLARVHCEIERQLGALDGWFVCTHAPAEGCACRKPQPGLVQQAARAFDVPAGECAVIGDIGSDVQAARSAGARGVLVPTPRTLPAEIAASQTVCENLLEAVQHLV